jgi:hypothetical protein
MHPCERRREGDGQVRVWLMDQGGGRHGLSATLNISEFPKDAVASSLSQVLITDQIPQKYFLSAKACRRTLLRAAARARTLPGLLVRALRAVADSEPTSKRTEG